MENERTLRIDSGALRLAGTLLLLVRALDQRLRQASPIDKLSISDLSVLSQIDRGYHLPSALARNLQLDPARVTRIVDRLVIIGYVLRGADRADRRRCPLYLTESGGQRLIEARVVLSAAMENLLSALGDEERAGLTRALEQVRCMLECLPDDRQDQRDTGVVDAQPLPVGSAPS